MAPRRGAAGRPTPLRGGGIGRARADRSRTAHDARQPRRRRSPRVGKGWSLGAHRRSRRTAGGLHDLLLRLASAARDGRTMTTRTRFDGFSLFIPEDWEEVLEDV